MSIKLLEKEFKGRGEVKGFEFSQMRSSTTAYLYKTTHQGVYTSYEVILRKSVPMCIDFEKRIFSDTEFKEVYPKAKTFGVDGWAYNSFENALAKFESL